MPEKPKPAKKIKKASPASNSEVVRPQKAARPATYYLSLPNLGPPISTQKPRGAAVAESFDSFEKARSAALTGLIDTIERLEAQLQRVRHAASLAELAD